MIVLLFLSFSLSDAAVVANQNATHWCMEEPKTNFGLCPAASARNAEIALGFLKEINALKTAKATNRREETEKYLVHVFGADFDDEAQTKVRDAVNASKFTNVSEDRVAANRWPFGMFDQEQFPAAISSAVFLIVASTPRWHPIYYKIAHKLNHTTASNTTKPIDANLVKEAENWNSSDLLTLTTELGQTIRLAASCPKAETLSVDEHLLAAYHNRRLHNATDAVKCESWADHNGSPPISVVITIGMLASLVFAFDF